jgi:hypothetical protein
VPTDVGAFVGWFPKGAMNVAVPLLSFTDVEREFGGLHTMSDTSFALWQYFRNGGHRAWAVRVAAPGAGSAALAKASVSLPTVGAGNAFIVNAVSEGAWGNDLTIQVIGPDDDARFDLVIVLRGRLNGRPTVREEERFTGLTTTTPTDLRYLPRAVNGVSRLIDVAPGGGEYSTPLGSGATSLAPITSLAGKADRSILVTLGGLTDVSVTLPERTLDSAAAVAFTLQSSIRAAQPGDPVWTRTSVVALGNGRLQVVPGMGDGAHSRIADDGTDTTASDLSMPASPTRGSYELAGGGDGAHPGASEIVGSEVTGGGMFALEDTDFTLLCLPSIANQEALALDGLADVTEYETITGSAMAFCREKRALLLLDPPDTHASPTAIETWLADHSSIRDE